jgi:hypothetical protein
LANNTSVQQKLREEGCMPSLQMHVVAAEVATTQASQQSRQQPQALVFW